MWSMVSGLGVSKEGIPQAVHEGITLSGDRFVQAIVEVYGALVAEPRIPMQQ